MEQSPSDGGHSGRRWSPERKAQAGFAFAFICLAAAGVALYINVRHLQVNAGWVDRTHQVLTQLDRLLSLATDAETAERGYVITGDEEYLNLHRAADAAIGETFRELSRLTADEASQQLRLRKLMDLIAARLAKLRIVEEARRNSGFEAAQRLIQTGAGKTIHKELRRQVGQAALVERALLDQRQREVGRSIVVSQWIGGSGSLLALLCILWAALVRRRDLAERKRIEKERETVKASLASQLEDMQRLHELSTRLIAAQQLPELLEEILNATIRMQGADFGNIQLYDPESSSLRIVAQRGFSQAFLDHFGVVRADDPSACGRALQQRERVIIEDVEQDADYAPHRQIAAQSGFRAVQSSPMIGSGGHVEGVLSTHFRRPHRPSDRDLQMTDLYMHVAAELLQHARISDMVRASRDEADRANRAKSRFLATASHDLRQPLQALSLLNGTLGRLIKDADAADAIAQQEQAIAVMSRLLNALLDISKLESGAVKPQIASFSLATLFDELRVEFCEMAARKGLSLEIVSCSDFALSDPTLLGQILRNLLGNAIRYTRVGSVRVQCRREGEQLRIDVADTGIGIPPEHLASIFEEFYQVGVSMNAVREGHGLGLNIVRRVAQLLSHPMRVDSVPGKGSVFSVIVPIGAEIRAAPAMLRTVTSMTSSTRKVHVLIVDDDLSVLKATRTLLNIEGYRVSSASSLDGALECARSNPDVALLVTDFHLGGGRLGTEVVHSVRSVLGRRVKAVLVTGDTSSAMSRTANEDDMRLISKPINADELVRLLRTLSEESSQQLASANIVKEATTLS
jgi:signal transduction histidine kinase/CHASE3 domain sensor protein/CheY-like chemotaxis protein